ncbi:hypothetical protein ACKI1Q_44590, partial [Streptomyces galilaeus]|uniref:hypothetical protein n=1 Tax=Streptomyces galilaeus TaxID=33899 RepID=UPI0038F7D148
MVNHFGNPTNIETVDNGYRFVFKRKEDVVSVYTNTKSVPYEIDDTGLETNVQYQKVHLMDSFKTLCLRRGMPQFYRFGNPSD